LAILSHTPEGSDSSENIAWVGKGIVYDTGGLSIKGKVRKIKNANVSVS
jgi:probable aminopeptidase NPEPL1